LSSGRFPSVFHFVLLFLRFRLYQTLSCPISSAPFRFPLLPFGFRVSLSGGSDFIRDSESEFPAPFGLAPST
ncbi:hypothetical protein ACWGH2_39040, partial [Streptomyces sp. NPDC054871]